MKDPALFLPERLRQVAEGDDDTVVQSPEDVMHLRAVPQADDKKDENIGNAGGKNAAGVFSEMGVPIKCKSDKDTALNAINSINMKIQDENAIISIRRCAA